MKRTVGYLSALIMLIGIGFYCTIQDDNGDLALSGPNTPSGPNIKPTNTPALFASAESAYVKLNDTLPINIRVLSDSTLSSSTVPLKGALVTISTTKGILSTDSVYTDSNGRAIVWFTDTSSGRVELTVKSYGAQQGVRFDVTNTPDKIQKLLQAFPQQSIISADGKDYTFISVRVMNKDHNPIVGEVVQFITTAGVIAGEAPPSSNSGQSVTDKNGVARAKLTSANINDTAFITAFLVSDRSLSDEVKVAFQGVTIQVQMPSSNLKVDQEAIVIAKVQNGANEPIAFTPIYFAFSKDISSNIMILSMDSTTGLDGTARAIIKGTRTGSDSLLISSAGAKTNTRVNITNLSLTLTLEDAVIQARKGLSTVLHALFTQNDGTKLTGKKVQVTRIYKTAAGADTTDTLVSYTDTEGKAAVRIYSIPYEGNMRLEVSAFNSNEDIASGETIVQFITTRTMTINALPSVIQADGTTFSTITVQVKNEDNNPIVGDIIDFVTDAGMVTGSAKTDENGRAIAKLTSDRRNTIATVTASLEKDPTKSIKIQVEFAGVTLTASASPMSINSSGKDTCLIVLSLTDGMKNPIVGEQVNFTKQLDATTIVVRDSITNNRGEARAKIVGTGSGKDTITAQAAGANAKTVISYSSNYLKVDTATFQRAIANGQDSTQIRITYFKGDKQTPIDNATIDMSVTVGAVDSVVFAKTITLTSGDNGIKYVWMKNPSFATTATIHVTARMSTEATSGFFNLYFKASKIAYITLTGTPEVIGTNGDRAKITAVAYDAQNNRVKDAILSFNMLTGPGGGEKIEPATAITAEDGTASTYLISGTIPSMYRQVCIAAGDFTGLKSDTVKFTIAGPPHYITIRRNLGEITKYSATYGKKVAAIITDINGNPVADGTEVTFSLQVTGYKIFSLHAHFVYILTTDRYLPVIDTVGSTILPFEDLNNNFKLDPGEDINRDGIASRGEDLNGDGIFQTGPAFEDINWNGVRDTQPEPIHYFKTGTDNLGQAIYDSVFADYNGNNRRDLIEPLINTTMTDSAYRALSQAIPVTHQFDIDWNSNGVPDPSTAITIKRTVQTIGGVADNEIVYGQSDGWRVQVKIWAESQGKATSSPEQFILPIEEGDAKYWRYRD